MNSSTIKFTQSVFRIIILLSVCITLSQCKKDSTCHTCSLPCTSCKVTSNYYSSYVIYSSTFCGTTSTIAAWKQGISATYRSPDYVEYYTEPDQTKQVCGSADQTNSAIATYTTAGYTCN